MLSAACPGHTGILAGQAQGPCRESPRSALAGLICRQCRINGYLLEPVACGLAAGIDNLGPCLVAVLIFVGTARKPNPPAFAVTQGAAAQNEAAGQLKIEKGLERAFLKPAKICCRCGRFWSRGSGV